jgi:hypothetical protein
VCFIPRQTGRLTVGLNIRLRLRLRLRLWVSLAVGSQLVQLGSYSEIGDSQGGREAVNTQLRKERRWKPLPDNDWWRRLCTCCNELQCQLAIALQLPVVTICKCLINPITNSNSVYSHSITWQYSSNTDWCLRKAHERSSTFFLYGKVFFTLRTIRLRWLKKRFDIIKVA